MSQKALLEAYKRLGRVDRRRAVQVVDYLTTRTHNAIPAGMRAKAGYRLGRYIATASPLQLYRLVRLADVVCNDHLDELGPHKALLLDGRGGREVIHNPFKGVA